MKKTHRTGYNTNESMKSDRSKRRRNTHGGLKKRGRKGWAKVKRKRMNEGRNRKEKMIEAKRDK